MKMSKVKDIIIDADHILFLVAGSVGSGDGFEVDTDADDIGLKTSSKSILKPYKEKFKAIVAEYEKIAQVESISYKWGIGKTRVIMSDWKNFRHDLYDNYKSKRKDKEGILKDLKKWAMKKYYFEPNTEADDVVAYYVRKGGIGFTTDKDLYKGVSGLWYNTHFKHLCWVRTSKQEAKEFFMQQCLAGDPVDEIPALPRVGLVTAKKMLDTGGYGWDTVFNIYSEKGFGEIYATTMIRLVCMSQWTPKKGIVLWSPPKK